eukprot:6184177-Pleurochrysis_carterae.AAC.3
MSNDDVEVSGGSGSAPTRSPVIISCTGNASQEGEHLMACGMTGVWNKPFPSFAPTGTQELPPFHIDLLKFCSKEDRHDLLSPVGLSILHTME